MLAEVARWSFSFWVCWITCEAKKPRKGDLVWPHPVLCTQWQLLRMGREGEAEGGRVDTFLSLSQATKPDTWGQNYSSHHASRQEEEGARRTKRKTRRKSKQYLPPGRGERARQVSNRCRLQDAGWRVLEGGHHLFLLAGRVG